MTYILTFAGQPVHTDTYWPNIHKVALHLGLAKLVWGCLFTLMPGVTIEKVYL